jgi:uncharacterized protein
MLTPLSPTAYTRIPWKNGGGVSTTIAGERLPGFAPGDWAGVVWQFGRTAIVTPAPFSDLSGFERLQTVVKGEGLFLDMPTGAIDLSVPLTVVRYDGGAPVVSRLARGPVEVVNLMARRDRVQVDMRVLSAGDRQAHSAGAHVFYAPNGAAALAIDGAAFDLPEDHALRLDGAGSVDCRAGVLIAASITPILPS